MFFANRDEISNPGGFPTKLTFSKLGTEHASRIPI